MTGEARAALDKLIAASSLEAAQLSHDLLLDAVLPGRAAIAVDADEVVAEISWALPGHAFPAYPLAVLTGVAQWLGAWTRLDAASSSADRAVKDAVAAEVRTLSQLRSVATTLMEAEPFKDPEPRSMSYLLIGVVLDAAESLPYLKRATEAEPDHLSAACGVEAVVVTLARSTRSPDPESVSWVRSRVASDYLTRTRVADAPYKYAGIDLHSNTATVDAIVGEHLTRANDMPRWPCECF